MTGQYVDERLADSRVNAKQRAVGHPVLLAGSTFVLGMVTGLCVKEAAQHMIERLRNRLWHREYERTFTYNENLPDSLLRREPAPDPGQPRYGGTGAIGVSPASVVTAQPEEIRNRR